MKKVRTRRLRATSDEEHEQGALPPGHPNCLTPFVVVVLCVDGDLEVGGGL